MERAKRGTHVGSVKKKRNRSELVIMIKSIKSVWRARGGVPVINSLCSSAFGAETRDQSNYQGNSSRSGGTEAPKKRWKTSLERDGKGRTKEESAIHVAAANYSLFSPLCSLCLDERGGKLVPRKLDIFFRRCFCFSERRRRKLSRKWGTKMSPVRVSDESLL